ncbi:tRNA dimethylallyltransferase [Elsinoe australis]|uniref:tRNA dimethylallyltransferase n=1 Tax=Elsinoe australis TaxID=40998 RepID=A0A2P7Z4J2_9PEZI|nr:tRNA dimethylallyltransferase [Elsinoe australis]
MTTKPKLIAVVGATGTGKSELAVSVASHFNGEILNADAMQLYTGLPVITNKIPVSERCGIPHHLLGCIGLDEQPWTVGKFVSSALETIEEIRARGKLPILVGGTHYYTQSLLFKDALADEAKGNVDVSGEDQNETSDVLSNGRVYEDIKTRYPVLDAPTAEILAKLQEVDPVMAERWHPNDRRKIQRSLEIWLQTGRRASDIYAEQKGRRGVDTNGTGEPEDVEVVSEKTVKEHLDTPSGLRMDTLLFWVHAQTDTLYDRLNGRVDKMMNEGLMSEVEELSSYAKTHPDLDQTSGIWVSIGYKEFLPYIKHTEQEDAQATVQKPENESIRTETAQDDALSKKLLSEGVEATKAGTRQYAKRQVRWIRIKLMNALQSARPVGEGVLYVLDGSDISRFQEDVLTKAQNLSERWLKGDEMPDPASVSQVAEELLKPKREDLSNSVGKWERQFCTVCKVVGVTPSDWDLHVKSRRHRRNIAKVKEQDGVRNYQHEEQTGVELQKESNKTTN